MRCCLPLNRFAVFCANHGKRARARGQRPGGRVDRRELVEASVDSGTSPGSCGPYRRKIDAASPTSSRACRDHDTANASRTLRRRARRQPSPSSGPLWWIGEATVGTGQVAPGRETTMNGGEQVDRLHHRPGIPARPARRVASQPSRLQRRGPAAELARDGGRRGVVLAGAAPLLPARRSSARCRPARDRGAGLVARPAPPARS